MAEWVSTKNARYWMHHCGMIVPIRHGLPATHLCRVEESYRSKEGHVTTYSYGKCLDCGARVDPDDRNQHSAFHNNFIHRAEVKDGFIMSAVKWCDMGNHAFKASAPGAQSIRVTQGSEDVMMDMCAEHAFPTAITPPVEQTMRAVESSYEQNLQQEYQRRAKERLATPMYNDTVAPND